MQQQQGVKPLSESSSSNDNIANIENGSKSNVTNETISEKKSKKKSKRKSEEDNNNSEVKRRKSSEVDQILNSNASAEVFNVKEATKKVKQLKVTEIREELKMLGCSGKELRGRKAQLVKKLVKMMKQEFDEEKEFLNFPEDAAKEAAEEEEDENQDNNNNTEQKAIETVEESAKTISLNSVSLETITEDDDSTN